LRRPESYRRRVPQREPYDYILIVCEGEKTEPNYFHGLRQAHTLSSANIEIVRPPAHDPINIVEYAERRLIEDGYDRAYCVFDRNGHTGFDAALRKIASSENGKHGRLHAITSVPCFEVWILLHFSYSSSPFNKAGSQSACDRVLAEVKRHFPDYTKGYQDAYAKLAAKVTQAVTNATRLQKENLKTGSTNPGTHMHMIVDHLRNLKSLP
jgi:hypothetical protein